MIPGQWPIKTLTIKECRRCKTTWSSERVELVTGDQINFARVTIAYCPACHESFATQEERPTYERRGKRI